MSNSQSSSQKKSVSTSDLLIEVLLPIEEQKSQSPTESVSSGVSDMVRELIKSTKELQNGSAITLEEWIKKKKGNYPWYRSMKLAPAHEDLVQLCVFFIALAGQMVVLEDNRKANELAAKAGTNGKMKPAKHYTFTLDHIVVTEEKPKAKEAKDNVKTGSKPNTKTDTKWKARVKLVKTEITGTQVSTSLEKDKEDLLQLVQTILSQFGPHIPPKIKSYLKGIEKKTVSSDLLTLVEALRDIEKPSGWKYCVHVLKAAGVGIMNSPVTAVVGDIAKPAATIATHAGCAIM